MKLSQRNYYSVEAEFAALPLWAKAQLMGYEARGGELCRR